MANTKELFVSDQRAVRECFGKSDKDISKDIDIIREWLKTQAHLPEIPNDHMIEMFLVTNKFSIERTKQRLDMYYTIRSLIPEIYEHSNPLLPPMVDVPDNMCICVTLPKQTKDLYRVYVMKIVESDKDFDSYKVYAQLFNALEMKLQHDAAVGDVFVIDHQNLTMANMLKITPSQLKKGATVLEKVFSNRVKGIHVLNWIPYVDVLLNLIKAMFKPKIFGRIYLHNSLEELYEHIPREILPKDYGGDERSIDELNELCQKVFKENSDRFDKLDQMRVNEDLRPTPLENDEILGYHGNFKKLDVD